jgi:catechol 2,3-dioxygenase-like lactoylglutathione lyase family enzyme
MLGDKEATASLGVKNIEAARRFYEGTLGLKKLPGEERGALVYKAGNSTILVYESQYAGDVGKDVDGVVKALGAKGVTFEKYDIPGTTRQGDIHVQGGRRLAWFKDPDGNIHALLGK